MSYEHTITDLPTENEYPKLVRDRIPEIIKDSDNIDVPVRVLEDDTEYLTFLLKKVIEEAEELSAATTDSDLIEEMADVEESINAILALKGISREEVLGVQDEKRAKRGGFADRLLLLSKH